MPRAVWSGTLSFGLVTLPVRLFPATEPKDVRFHLYDAQGRRVRYRRVVDEPPPVEPWPDPWEDRDDPGSAAASTDDPAAGVPAPAGGRAVASAPDGEGRPTSAGDARERDVSWDEISHGIEDPSGGVVLVSRDEIEAVRPGRSRSIDVEDFVDLRDIDPVFFEKTYYVAPSSPDALRPYALLLRAMEDAGRVGIGRFVLRTKPHLVAIRPMRGVLALETLFFGDEVRDPSALVRDADAVEVSDRELDLAQRLISTLGTTWDPAAYADTYREDLLRILAEKTPSPVTRHDPTPASSPGSAVEDLMRALKESVEAATDRSEGRANRARPRRVG
jgi:DNA end-binding protein Ku